MRHLLVGLLLLFASHARAAEQTGLVVFAAASLTESLPEIGALWAARGHRAPRFSFAASSALARQIEQGANANLFASADQRWMDYLNQRGFIAAGSERNLLSNRLVLVVPGDGAPIVTMEPGTIGPGMNMMVLLGPSGRLAMGDPAHVPAGIYAEQALRRLGLWDAVAPRLARAENVRAALRLVERGEAPAGIVYATDVVGPARVRVAGVFPPDSHDRISYPFAVTRTGDTAEARAFLGFLATDVAHAVFRRHGFVTE